MTKTGLANKELEARKEIASRDRKSREDIATKDRKWKAAGDMIKTAGKLAGSLGVISNDPKWYKRLPEMAGISNNVPGYMPNATPFNNSGTNEYGDRLPMVKTLFYQDVFESNASIGNEDVYVTGPSSALNLAAQRLLTELRKYNSRIGEYEPGDLFQVIAGEVEVLKFLLFVKRALLSYTTFNAYNPQLARHLLSGQGFNYDSIAEHFKDLQKWLAVRISEVNTFFTIPADMTYALRKLYMVSTVYKEGTGDNAQYVQYVPITFGQYIEEDGMLDFLYWPQIVGSPEDFDNGMTFGDILTMYNNLVNSFTNSTVLTTIIADIRSAQGLTFLSIGDYKPDETLVLKPISEVMTQVMNATVCPWVGITSQGFRGRVDAHLDPSAYDELPFTHIYNNYNRNSGSDAFLPYISLSQDENGFLQQGCYFDGHYNNLKYLDHYGVCVGIVPSGSWPSGFQNKMDDFNKFLVNCNVLNFYDKGNVTDDDILEATRLHATWKLRRTLNSSLNSVVITLELVSSCTEVIMFEATSYNYNNNTKTVRYTLKAGYLGYDLNAETVGAMHSFNYEPLHYGVASYVIDNNGVLTPGNNQVVFAQWDKVVQITTKELIPINEMCIRSLVYVNPSSGFRR